MLFRLTIHLTWSGHSKIVEIHEGPWKALLLILQRHGASVQSGFKINEATSLTYTLEPVKKESVIGKAGTLLLLDEVSE